MSFCKAWNGELASFRSVDMGIPEVLADPDLFFDRVIDESLLAVTEDGAEVIVLAEMTPPAFWERAQEEPPSRSSTPGSPAGSGRR